MLHLCIDTDRDPHGILQAVRDAARGSTGDACVVWVEGYGGEDARRLWAQIQGIVAGMSAHPGSRPLH